MKKLILFSFAFLYSVSAHAQIFDLLKDKVKDKVVASAGTKVSNMLTTEAITSNFKDCDITNIKNPDFGKKEKYQNLCNADFTDRGFILKPGYYELNVKSFCLKAGTYAPSKGDGYLYAPLKGPKKEIVDKLVKNWFKNQQIDQHSVQALIWAIIAKASFKSLSTDLQLVATKLLSTKDILTLSKMGLDFVPSGTMNDVKSSLPKSVQVVLDAENKMRQLFSSSSYNYAELEKYAMLAGFNTEKSPTERGTWGLHPDGYWVAYFPNGYQQMTLRIYVPNTITTVNFIPSNQVAVPANTSSQRLMLSDVKNCN